LAYNFVRCIAYLYSSCCQERAKTVLLAETSI